MVLFSPFYQLKFYLVNFNSFSLIQSISIPFSAYWPYLVHIGPILFTSVHSVHFGSIQFIMFTLVLFGLFCSILSTLVYFDIFQSYSNHSVHFILIQSTLVLFGPFYLLWSYSVYIALILSNLPTLIQIMMLKCRCSSKRIKIDCLCFRVQGQVGEKYVAWML